MATTKQALPVSVAPDTAIVLIGPGYWGKGRTLAEAYSALTKHSGTLKAGTKLQVFITDKDATVSGNGYLTGQRADDCGLVSIEAVRKSIKAS